MIPHLRLHSDLLFGFFFCVYMCVYTSPLLWRLVNIVRVSFTSVHGSSRAHGNVLCKNMRCAYCDVLWQYNKWREKLTASSGKYISVSWICLYTWDKVRVRKSLERFWKRSCQRLLTHTQSMQFAVWYICISSHERRTFWINRNTQDSGWRKSLFYGHSASEPVSNLIGRTPTSVLALSQDWLHHTFHLTLWHRWHLVLRSHTSTNISSSPHHSITHSPLAWLQTAQSSQSVSGALFIFILGLAPVEMKVCHCLFHQHSLWNLSKKLNVTYLESKNSAHGSFGHWCVPITLSSLQRELWEDVRSAKREQSA